MSNPAKLTEPIPGYFLKERIGVGGYGEVWSAQAPGDLSKALKFVYGHFDDERAARELKALKRIKEVRHPFLLSLERIEIIDGQLIIVTELADMSLKDRFEQASADGTSHIPREELLGYLRDAADALDYMSDTFSLQHLDVKPENLLIVGKRVKVADFGLVKELQDVTASLMGGLTPVYASPEVFDGRPSQRSDQYSLAIVYQELLTGVLPFPGKTAAQLASQHLHARPRLAPLPANDQPIIARALSKDPAQRFANCRELVDCLTEADKPARGNQRDGAERSRAGSASDTTPIRSRAVDTDHDWRRSVNRKTDPPSRSPDVKTLVIGEEAAGALGDESATSTDLIHQVGEPLLPPSAPVEAATDLPPIELQAAADGLRPTLFVGIGGTATRTLRQLRRKLHDRLGKAGSLPAVQMLLFDTDARMLYEATQGDNQTALADTETVRLPLRSAHDYTADSSRKFHWLSRRWLYNIPRSLQTEGRRPLGRLALVDHAELVRDRVRKVVTAMVSPESIEATAQAAGMQFASNVPRVFVVSSISGGTGSGMVLDMAYVVRTILADLGLADDAVCGVLAHATDRNPAAGELAIANAYACLSELYHYSGAGCYPGDDGCGLPAFAAFEGTFPSAYVVHLGDNLSDQEFDQATDALASYLYLNTVPPAAAAFHECRKHASESAGSAAVRSFGLVRIGSSHTMLPALATDYLCREVVNRWRGVSREAPAPAAARSSLLEMATPRETRAATIDLGDVERRAADYASRLDLDYRQMTAEIGRWVDEQLGGTAEATLGKLRTELEQGSELALIDYVHQTLTAIGNIFGPSAAPQGSAKLEPSPIEKALEDRVKRFAAEKGVAVRDWVLSLLEATGARVAATARAKQWFDICLHSMEAQTADRSRQLQQEVQTVERALREAAALPVRKRTLFGRRAKPEYTQFDEVLAQLIGLRCEHASAQLLAKALRSILAHVSAAGDLVADLQRELGQLAQEFDKASPWDEASHRTTALDVVNDVRSAVAESLHCRISEFVRVVDENFQTGFLEPRGGLRNVFQRADAVRCALVTALRACARSQILKALNETSIDRAVLGPSASADDCLQRLQSCLDAARPKLNRCGGAQRLMAISSQAFAESQLAQAFVRKVDPAPMVVLDADADLVLCYEAQDLWIPYVAARLVGDRGDLVQVAKRLHTRTDVVWTDLARATAPVDAALAGN